MLRYETSETLFTTASHNLVLSGEGPERVNVNASTGVLLLLRVFPVASRTMWKKEVVSGAITSNAFICKLQRTDENDAVTVTCDNNVHSSLKCRYKYYAQCIQRAAGNGNATFSGQLFGIALSSSDFWHGNSLGLWPLWHGVVRFLTVMLDQSCHSHSRSHL